MIDILAVGHAPILAVNRALYRGLAQRGWNTELAIPTHLTIPGPKEVDPRGGDDPPIHFLKPAGDNIRYWRFEGLAELVRQRRPRIIFLENEPDSRMAWELGGVADSIGAKLVLLSNENDFPNPLGALLRGHWKPALRSLRARLWCLVSNHRVDHVFAICQEGVACMEALGFKGRASFTPLGFDPGLFRLQGEGQRTATRARLGLTRPAIAYFGRLMHIKGVHVLVAALACMKNLDWQFMLDEVNEDQDQYVAALNAAIRAAGIEDRCVRFHATHAQMPDVMNAADIAVVPSVWKEQYGRVAPEAMACGRAVVVSYIGALPDLVGDCGVKVPPGDVNALAGALGALLLDAGERSRLGQAASQRARDVLSLDAQVKNTDGVLRRL